MNTSPVTNLESISVEKIRLMDNDDDVGTAFPVDLSVKEVLDSLGLNGVNYGAVEVMAARQYTTKEQGRRPRFRFLICKGKKQLKKHVFPLYGNFSCLNFTDFIVRTFYLKSFKDEKPALTETAQDPEMWHIILIGQRSPTVADFSEHELLLKNRHKQNENKKKPGKKKPYKEDNTRFFPSEPSDWHIISACSFKLVADGGNATIYLPWIVVSDEKASMKDWNPSPKKTKPSPALMSKLRLLFDDKPFSGGKGIGKTMIAVLQYTCKLISQARSFPSLPMTIICESNDAAVVFYKLGVGMIHTFAESSSSSIPKSIQDVLFSSWSLTPLRLQESVMDVRPPNIRNIYIDFHTVVRNAIIYVYRFERQTAHDTIATQLPSQLSMIATRIFFQPPQAKIDFLCSKLSQKELPISLTLKGLGNIPDHSELSTSSACSVLIAFLMVPEDQANFVHVPLECIGLSILRCVIYCCIQNFGPSHLEYFHNPQHKCLHDWFFSYDDNASLDRERQFLLNFCWHVSKMNTGVPELEYNDEKLYCCKRDDSIESDCLHLHTWLSNFGQKNSKVLRDTTDFERTYMNGAFLESILSIKKSQKILNQRCPPKKLQDTLHSFATTLAENDSEELEFLREPKKFIPKFTLRCEIHLVLISFIFKIRFMILRLRQKKDKHIYFIEREFVCAVQDGEISQTIVINKSPVKDSPGEFEWSILLNKGDELEQIKKMQENFIWYSKARREEIKLSKEEEADKEGTKQAVETKVCEDEMDEDDREFLSLNKVQDDLDQVDDKQDEDEEVEFDDDGNEQNVAESSKEVIDGLNPVSIENKKTSEKKDFLTNEAAGNGAAWAGDENMDPAVMENLAEAPNTSTLDRFRNLVDATITRSPMSDFVTVPNVTSQLANTGELSFHRDSMVDTINYYLHEHKMMSKVHEQKQKNLIVEEPNQLPPSDKPSAVLEVENDDDDEDKPSAVLEFENDDDDEDFDDNSTAATEDDGMDANDISSLRERKFSQPSSAAASKEPAAKLKSLQAAAKQPSHASVAKPITGKLSKKSSSLQSPSTAVTKEMKNAARSQAHAIPVPAAASKKVNSAFRKVPKNELGIAHLNCIQYDKPNPDDNSIMDTFTYKYSSKKLDGKIRTPKQIQDQSKGHLNIYDIPSEKVIIDLLKNADAEKLKEKYSTLGALSFSKQDAQFANIQKEIQERYAVRKEMIEAELQDLVQSKNSKKKSASKDEILKQITDKQNELIALAVQMKNDVFLYHPDSLVAIRQLPTVQANKMYRFEGITASCFEHPDQENPGSDYSVPVPLTRNWVRQNFDSLFTQRLQEDCEGQEFLHLRDIEKNITERDQVMATKYEDYKNKILKKEESGQCNIFLIMAMKVVAKFKNRDRKWDSRTWYVKSIGKSQYLYQKTRKLQVSDWLEIDEALVLHNDCFGPAKANKLYAPVKKQRETELHKQSNVPNVEQTLEAEQDFTKELEARMKQDPLDLTDYPQYTSGHKQIASIRFCNERNFYYGRVVDSVTNGKRKYSTECLPPEWVEDNLSKDFQEFLKSKSESLKYIWIPVGAADPNKVYPYEYNVNLPRIAFPQGEMDTCITSSFASCLIHLGYEDTAKWVEEFGKDYVKDPSNDQSRIMQRLAGEICTCPGFSQKWVIQRLNPSVFDIWNQNDRERQRPMLFTPIGHDGFVGHAITIYDGMIFDSNLKYAVELNDLNLEFCIDAVYEGVLYGYEFIRKSTKKKNKRRQLKRKQQKRLKTDCSEKSNDSNKNV